MAGLERIPVIGDIVFRKENREKIEATVVRVHLGEGVEEPTIYVQYTEGGLGYWPMSALLNSRPSPPPTPPRKGKV